MKTIYLNTSVSDTETVVALGNFDGMHKGHTALMDKVLEISRSSGLTPSCWTFENYSPRCRGVCLTDTKERSTILSDSGIELLLLSKYEDVCNMSSEEFVCEILVKKCRAKKAVCGFNFRFGKGAASTNKDLFEISKRYGIEVFTVDPVLSGGECVSSTLIRGYLSQGDVTRAAELLGRPFSVQLPVLHGQRLGSRLGFPTINQVFPSDIIIPRHGVYVTDVILDGKEYRAVTNVGTRPTVDGHHVVCESYIIGYDGDLYGKTVKLSFRRFIRNEIKFNSLEELKCRIALDVEEAKKG